MNRLWTRVVRQKTIQKAAKNSGSAEGTRIASDSEQLTSSVSGKIENVRWNKDSDGNTRLPQTHHVKVGSLHR